MDFNMHLKQIINTRAEKDLAHTDAINGDQFEVYMTYILNHSGYHHVIHTPYSNDHGVDAYSKVDSISWQFKDYKPSHKVLLHAVDEVLLGAAVYNTKYNVVLTNSYFPKKTCRVVRKADKNNYKGYITLINRPRLLKLFKVYEKLKIERSARYQKQKKQAEIKKRIEHKEYHLASILANKLDTFKRQVNSINDNIISVLSGNLNRIQHQSGAIENKFTSILANNADNLNQQVNSIRGNTTSVLNGNLNRVKHQSGTVKDKFTHILSSNLNRTRHQSDAIENKFTSILANNTDNLNQQVNSINDNITSVLSSSLNKIQHQSGAIKNKFTYSLRYRLSNLLTRIKHISHLKKLLPLYLANNTLRNNIIKSKSIHNFNSHTKQFAYYALTILPKYHMTLDSLVKKINDSVEIVHPLNNGTFYITLTINIEYPEAINQLTNGTKQHIIFAYYPIEYVNKNYPNNYPKHIFNFDNKSHTNDIYTIISNFQCNDIIAKDGYDTRKQIMPIDKDSNLYSQDKFSVNTKVFDVSNTHVNINDINVLARIMKLNQDSNYKKEAQSNADYLNEFYQDRHNIISKIKVMNRARKQTKKLKAFIHKLQIRNAIKKYHQLNNIIEACIDKSKMIHDFHSRTKQFAYCTLMLLPEFNFKTNNIIRDISNAKVKRAYNWDSGYNKTNYCPLGSQANKSFNYFKLDIKYKKIIKRILFIYYSPKIMKTEYTNGFPCQNLYRKALNNDVHHENLIGKLTISLSIKRYDIISNLVFNSSKPLIHKSNHLGNIYQYQFKYNDMSVVINDIKSLFKSLNVYKNRQKQIKIKKAHEAKVRIKNARRKVQRQSQIRTEAIKNSKKYHQLNSIIEHDIDKSKAIYNFDSRTKQFAFCTLLLLSKYDVNKYIDNINRATVKRAYNWDTTNNTKFGNQSNKSYYYLELNMKYNDEFKRILFIYYPPEIMRTEYKDSFPYQKLYKKALDESLYRGNLIGNVTTSFDINTYIFISNLIFNPQSSRAVIKSVNHKSNYFSNINQYQLKQGDMFVAINDIKSLTQGHNIYNNKHKAKKAHEAKVRTEAIKNSKKYRQLNSIIEHDIDKSKAIYNFSSRVKQFAFCTLMQSVVYYPYTNNLIKAINNATVKQSTNKDDGHGKNKNDFPLSLQRGKIFNYLELHADSPIYNGFYNDNLYFVYYAPNEYEYGYPYQDISGNDVIGHSHYYDDDFDNNSEFYNEYSYTIISNFLFNQQSSKLEKMNVGFQGNGQVIQYHSHYSVKTNTYVDDIKTLVQSSNVYNNYYTKFQQRMYSYSKYLINEREIPTHLTDNSIYSPLLLDKFNLHKYHADKHQEQINHKDFEDKLQHINPRDRQLTLEQIRSTQRARKRNQQMYERAQHIKRGIHTLGQQSLKQGIKLGTKGFKWIKNFADQHMQTKPYMNIRYKTLPNQSFKVCPNCHSRVLANSRYCIYCGYYFNNNDESNESFKICPNCHNKVSKSSHFCINCGYHFIK